LIAITQDLNWIQIDSSLLAIQAMKTLTTLIFDDCDFECDLDIFPSNLKIYSLDKKHKARIGNLPESQTFIELHRF
jgi:hypothetical protein